MSNFLLTFHVWWVYAPYVNAKSLIGFGSLLDKRILPLRGIFYVRNLMPLLFFGWVFWGASGLAGLIPGLPTRLIRPPCQTWLVIFPKSLKQRSMNHDSI